MNRINKIESKISEFIEINRASGHSLHHKAKDWFSGSSNDLQDSSQSFWVFERGHPPITKSDLQKAKVLHFF